MPQTPPVCKCIRMYYYYHEKVAHQSGSWAVNPHKKKRIFLGAQDRCRKNTPVPIVLSHSRPSSKWGSVRISTNEDSNKDSI